MPLSFPYAHFIATSDQPIWSYYAENSHEAAKVRTRAWITIFMGCPSFWRRWPKYKRQLHHSKLHAARRLLLPLGQRVRWRSSSRMTKGSCRSPSHLHRALVLDHYRSSVVGTMILHTPWRHILQADFPFDQEPAILSMLRCSEAYKSSQKFLDISFVGAVKLR